MPLRTSRLFSWLNDWRDDELRGTLSDIFIADAAGQPMRRLTACLCLPGIGLAGDRYASGKGHWIKTDGCEVTLVTGADLARAGRQGPVSFAAGEHRRNLVIEGVPLDALRRRRVRIGPVLFEFHRLRPPCGYLDRLLQPGAGKALGRGAGVGLRVLCEGVIRVGDSVEVLRAGPDAREDRRAGY
jgi:MOSC domain-containing protein YiiM